MDYQKIYNALIEKRKLNPATKQEFGYVEVHHIVPRCIGGGDEDENLVALTYREHIFAHKLLAKIHDVWQLWFTVKSMLGKNISSRLAAIVRQKNSEQNGGEGNPMYGKSIFDFMTDEQIAQWKEKRSAATKGSKNPMYGKSSWSKCTPEQRADRIERFRKSIKGKNKGRKFEGQKLKNIQDAHKKDTYRKKISKLAKARWKDPNFRKKIEEANARLHEQRSKHISEINKGRHWYTDGTINVHAHECPEGFKPGMTRRKKNGKTA